ncbi:MAG: anti-sigma factor family protein [Sandaracinaceae bacterium]
MESKQRDERLMQHYDGELSPSEAAAFDRELAEDAELRARREGLRGLTSLVREGASAMAADLDSDALFAAVQASLEAPDAEAPDAGPPLRVGDGGAEDAPSRPRRTPLYVVGAGLALAAAALLALLLRDPAPPPQSTPPEVAAAGSEVLDADFGSSTGTIFSVEGQDGARYAVVWISDEELPEEGGATP